jgi:peroxiredoxin
MTRGKRHLKVGDLAPPFMLCTNGGQEIRLADVLRSMAAMVVFIRGTW